MTPSRDLEAKITFLTVDKGGQTQSVASGLRCQFYYDKNEYGAIYEFPDMDKNERVKQGDTVRAYITLFAPVPLIGIIAANQKFQVKVGQRVIGNSDIIAILGLYDHADGIMKVTRRRLVAVIKAMLEDYLVFLKGAVLATGYREDVGHIKADDPDFNILAEVANRANHLALPRDQYFSLQDVDFKTNQKLKMFEDWAKSNATQACINLIKRFDTN